MACLVTPSAVYLSADSRYANAPPTLRDSARKLVVCGRTALCGLSGLLRFTRTESDLRGDDFALKISFELSDVVEEVGLENDAGDEPGLAHHFTRRLHMALTPIWQRFASDLIEPLGHAVRGKSMDEPLLRLAQLFYVNREESGRAFLATIDLTHSLRRSRFGGYSSFLEEPVVHRVLFNSVMRPRLYLRGSSRCVCPEPLCDAIDGEVEAMRIIEGVFARARCITKCAAAIGGPVDVAMIDNLGRRWLKQKTTIGRKQNAELPNGPTLRN